MEMWYIKHIRLTKSYWPSYQNLMVLIIPHSDENANLSLMVSQHKIAYKTSKEAVRRSHSVSKSPYPLDDPTNHDHADLIFDRLPVGMRDWNVHVFKAGSHRNDYERIKLKTG